MDSQNANLQIDAEVKKQETAPSPVVCRVCMHVNPAGTPVCQMCCNDLLSDAELDTLLAAPALTEEKVAAVTADATPSVATEEERPYKVPVFEDDEEVVVSKKAEKLLRKLDAAVAEYKVKADAYTEMIEKEKKAKRKDKIARKLDKLTSDVNKVIAKYREKLLRQKYDLPLYPWEVPANA